MKKAIATICLIFVLFSVKAQNDYRSAEKDTLESRLLPEIVVSANRINSVAVNTPEAIRVLQVKAVHEKQLRTASEALSISPGVFVQKTNHGGGSPFIRGLTGNQTLLLIDGVRLSNSTMRYGPNQYFNTIDVFGTGKIEVLRGNGSVQYGSDALGGTIQAFSRELDISEEAVWRGSLISRIASHGMEQTLRGNLGFSNDRSAFHSGVTWRNFGDIVGGDTTGRQTPTGYGEFDFDFKGMVRLSSESSLTMLLQSVKQNNIPIYHKILLENYFVNKTDPQQRRLAYLRLNQEISKGALESVAITASWQGTLEGRETRKNGSYMLRSETDRVGSLGFSAEAVFSKNGIWSGNSGMEIYNDRVSSKRTDTDTGTGISANKRGLYPNGATMTSIAAYSLNTFRLDKWSFTADARFNTYIVNVADEVLGKTSLKPSALVGNAAVLRKLNSSSSLFVSANRGFRAPNIDDLGTLGIVDFRYETPNFNLKPESSFQYQLGYKYQDEKIRGEFFVYRNELYDLITRVRVEDQMIDGYPLYMKENSERAFVQGVETSWELSVTRSWIVNGSMTYTYGQNITKDEPLRRIPPLFGLLNVDYRNRNFVFGAEWIAAARQSRLAAGDVDDNRIPDGGTPGWNVINLDAAYSFRFATFEFGLRNIFNKDYRYHGSGINGYGRSVLLTVMIDI